MSDDKFRNLFAALPPGTIEALKSLQPPTRLPKGLIRRARLRQSLRAPPRSWH